MARGRGELTPQDLRIRQTITANINRLIAKNGKKQIDIHNKTGIPKSTLTGYVKGTSTPSKGNLQKIADFFNVKKSEIDPRFKSEIPTNFELLAESNITTIYNQLNDKRKDKVYTYAEKQLDEQNSNKVIPLVGKTAANPAVLEYGDVDIEEQQFASIPNGADCAITVQGDSMEPEYKDGSIIFYREQEDVENGELAIVEIDGDGVTFKKVYFNYDEEVVVLKSLNNKYEDRELKPEQVRVIGKVL